MLNKITIFSIFLIILTLNAAAIAAEWTETSFKDFADGTYSDGGTNIYTTADGTLKIIGQQLDVNNDGYMDIVFSNLRNDSTHNINSYIYWGSLSGFSNEDKTELATHGAIGNSIADLNNDGYMDIIFSNFRNDSTYNINSYIYWGGLSGFSNEDKTELAAHGAVGNSIADLNDDGYLDIVFSNNYNNSTRNINSYIYWGSSAGFSVDDVPTELQTHGAHYNTTADLGNVYNRGRELVYTSNAYDTGDSSTFASISWIAKTPSNTAVEFQIRTAQTEAELALAEWHGPNGTSARYTVPDTPVNSVHSGDRWVQYRAYLLLSAPIGIATPSLEEVLIEYHQRCNVEISSVAPVDIGDQFNLHIYVADQIPPNPPLPKGGRGDLYGFSFDIHFDENILSALSATQGNFLNNDGKDATKWEQPKIDNNAGEIRGISCQRVAGDGVRGEGILVELTFKAVGPGISTIQIENASFTNPQGESIDASVCEGKLRVHPLHGELSGIVKDSDGYPLEGAEVAAVTHKNEIAGVSGWSDADGKYFIDMITEAGIYNVFARKNGFRNDLVTDVVVEKGESKHVDLILSIPRMVKKNDFLMEWLTLGPLVVGKDVSTMLQQDYLGGEANTTPEEEDIVTVGRETLLWRRKTLRTIDGNNLNNLFGNSEDAVGYLCLYFYINEPQRTILLGSDDGVAVWLNGEQVWENPVRRKWKQDEDRIGVALKKGWNRLLVKVIQDKDSWGVSVRLPDVDITDYRFSPPTPIAPCQTYRENIKLSQGVNLISLPLSPDETWTASTLAERIGSTIVIRSEEGEFQVYVPEGEYGINFPIEVSKGYIVNVLHPTTYLLEGKAWGEPIAAPDDNIEIDATSGETWAFVVAGNVAADSVPPSSIVRVVNTRTGQSVEANIDASGKFTAAFVDVTKRGVVDVGDKITVQIYERTKNEQAARSTQEQESCLFYGRRRYRITPENLGRAYLLANVRPLPTQTRLLQNYPNPFNPETWIPFYLAKDADVTIEIYNIKGNLVRKLSFGTRQANTYTTRTDAAYWNGRNDLGEKAASGVYFYVLKAGQFQAVRKLCVAK